MDQIRSGLAQIQDHQLGWSTHLRMAAERSLWMAQATFFFYFSVAAVLLTAAFLIIPERTNRLAHIHEALLVEVTERQRADAAVRASHQQLEQRVAERTGQLAAKTAVLERSNAELAQSEQALRLSEGRYRRLFETAQDAILISDAETGQVLDANPFMQVLLGYSLQEFVGQKLWEIGPFKGTEASKTAFAELQEKDHLHYEGLPLETHDGRRVEVEFVSNAFLVEGRRVIQCNFRDVTERKRLEALAVAKLAELARSNADLEQFASVASHDLQEPLRAVAGCVQMLKRKYRGHLDEKADALIRMTVEGSSRMKGMIDGLLAYSRSGQGEQLERVNAGTVLQSALGNLSSAVAETHAQITCENLPSVRFHPAQFEQIFQNLLGNALKYRSALPPAIHVGAERQGEGWRFNIADNGIGFEPEFAENIFRVFLRLHSREQYEGTGIGLAIVRRLVERRGGKVWAESVPAYGATFSFTVPDREPNTGYPHPGTLPAPSHESGEKVA